MISDVLSDAVADIKDYQRDMPDAYADLGDEIETVKAVMDSLRIVLDAAPDQPEEFEKLVEELRASIRDVDVSRLVAARERLLKWVRDRLPQETERDDSDAADDGWQHLGAVTVDTGRLLLVDPVHKAG